MAYVAVFAVCALGFGARVLLHRRHLARIGELEAESARLRAALRVNALRYEPGATHAEIDEQIARIVAG